MLSNYFEYEKSEIIYPIDFIPKLNYFINTDRTVQLVMCKFDATYYEPKFFSQFGIDFPKEITNSVKKRQADFLVGRILAQKALLQVCFSDDNNLNFQVGIGRCRSPIWPSGIKGSITHNNSHAACVLTRQSDKSKLGIDIEHILSDSSAKKIASYIHNPSELKLLLSIGLKSNVATTLIFSAKESLFKALYPFINFYFGFEHARVSAINIKHSSLTLELSKDFSMRYGVEQFFTCQFDIKKDTIFTLIAHVTQ